MIVELAALAVLPAGMILDLLLGDPNGLPHPIRWMGRLIASLEPFFRKLVKNEFRAGLLFAVSLILFTWISSQTLVQGARAIHPILGWAMEVLLIYYALSIKSLRDAAMAVYHALKKESLREAKQRLAMIVGRDVVGLDRRGVIRATVETVAENLVDGVVSPVFYAAIGGAPLAMTFKMVNTLDSMVGYKTSQYREFGKASARIDDLANFLPARLSIPVITTASHLLFGTGKRAWRTALREGDRHSSPNAGKPEAAFAGALGLKLGGPNYYHGTLVDKPFIGTRLGVAQPLHISLACQLMTLSAFLWLLVCWTCSSLQAVIAL
jgi:adenosylcobinamide-phosphate synthase